MSQARRRIAFVARADLGELIEKEGANPLVIDNFSEGALGDTVRQGTLEMIVFVDVEASISMRRLYYAQALLGTSDVRTVHLWGGKWKDDVVREPYLLELTAEGLMPIHSYKSLSKDAFCRYAVAHALERLRKSETA